MALLLNVSCVGRCNWLHQATTGEFISLEINKDELKHNMLASEHQLRTNSVIRLVHLVLQCVGTDWDWGRGTVMQRFRQKIS